MNFVYKSVEYAPGTKVKMNIPNYGEQILTYVSESYFVGFRHDNWFPCIGIVNKIVDFELEIVEPVYPQPIQTYATPEKGYPSQGTVEIAWIWYIIIMVFAAFFKDRIGIWIVVTICFFWWESKQV